MFPNRSRTAPTTPTLPPNLSVTPFPYTPLPPPQASPAPSPRSPPTSLSPLTPLTPLPAQSAGPSPPRHSPPGHSAPPNPFDEEMANFFAEVREAISPTPEPPHPLLSAPLPPPHAMAAYIHELRQRLVDADDELEYAHHRVRRAQDDNAYLCRQVTVLTEQREALRDRLEGRGERRGSVGREGQWYSGGREGKNYKEARYA